MNRWIRIILSVSLLVALALSVAWRYYVEAPARTQSQYETLVAELTPLIKRYPIKDVDTQPQTIETLLGGETSDEVDAIIIPKKPSQHIAESKLRGALIPYSPDNILGDYAAALAPFEPRFEALSAEHLTPCDRDDFYNQWAAVRQWSYWARVERARIEAPNDRMAEYESDVIRYAGRPLTFAQIKAAGEAEFASIRAALAALERQVKAEFGLDLEQFALREENFTTSPEDLVARVAPLLKRVEERFSDFGDFGFAPVPSATVTAKPGLGPNYAIASYQRRKNQMIIYAGEGRYNHIYDMMLVVHEIMPGHHQQIKMKKERSCGVGPLSAITPMLEGWASYAEILADERGLFDAPADRLGWLDYRLIRAMRIKLDAARVEDDISQEQGWSLWQETMPPRLHIDFEREWARVTQSRHHLSYIFGSQAILEARETVKTRLGDDFSEAEFHAALLNAHHRTLSFLPQRIDAQIYARRLKNMEPRKVLETSL